MEMGSEPREAAKVVVFSRPSQSRCGWLYQVGLFVLLAAALAAFLVLDEARSPGGGRLTSLGGLGGWTDRRSCDCDATPSAMPCEPSAPSECPSASPTECLPASPTGGAQSAALPLQDFRSLWGDFASFAGVELQRFWDRQALKNALSVASVQQMQPVFDKLYAGEPITAVAIGSSLVADFGGCYQSSVEAVMGMVPSPHTLLYAVEKGMRHGWVELFMRYVNAVFPHPDHILINAGGAAIYPAIFANAMCIEVTVPQRADIIIIETMAVIDPLNVERLVLRLLRHFRLSGQTRPPAVIIYNSFNVVPNRNDAPWWNCMLPPGGNFSECCQTFAGMAPLAWMTHPNQRYDELTEDQILLLKQNMQLSSRTITDIISIEGQGPHEELARFYGWTSISHRDFLWPYWKAKAWEVLGLPDGECEFTALVNFDRIHPSRLGMVLLADYLWEYMSTAHEFYVQSKADAAAAGSGEDGAATSLPAATMQQLTSVLRVLPLPPIPFQPGGRDIYAMRCYGLLGGFGWWPDSHDMDTLAQMGELRIVGGAGFEFVVNTTNGQNVKRKPGWVATSPGSYMDIQVNTFFDDAVPGERKAPTPVEGAPAGGGMVAPPEAEATVSIVYLKSYEHMGQAEVSCVSGCTCTPETVHMDAHHTERTSISGQVDFTVSMAKKCVLSVRVLEQTSSGEHKFKITQVVTKARVTEM